MSYFAAMVLVDAVLKEVSSNKKKRYQELISLIVQDLFLGSKKIIELIDEKFHPMFSDLFAKLQYEDLDNLEKTCIVAKKMGVKDLVKKIDTFFETRKKFDYFELL